MCGRNSTSATKTNPPRLSRGHLAARQAQAARPSRLIWAIARGVVGWRYDSASKLWARSLSGQPFDDAETGKPITAANVLVVNAFHAITLIQEDSTGSKSIQIQLWGEGPLKVFRDGKMIEGVWRRPGDVGVLELRDNNGQPIAKPGNTWIQLVPGDLEVTVES